MNKQELIEAYERISSFCGEISVNKAIENLKQLDEPTIYVKNVLARLRELPLHDREVWLKAIMGEFEQDFSHAKWREGYEQGKFEGAWVGNQLKDADKIRRELNRPVVPQFVADWIEKTKKEISLREAMLPGYVTHDVDNWLMEMDQDGAFINQDVFARAWLDGYEVEKEKRYSVVMKATKQPLYYNAVSKKMFFSMGELVTSFTRKELEDAGFGWVFDCPGIEIEEVY